MYAHVNKFPQLKDVRIMRILTLNEIRNGRNLLSLFTKFRKRNIEN